MPTLVLFMLAAICGSALLAMFCAMVTRSAAIDAGNAGGARYWVHFGWWFAGLMAFAAILAVDILA